MTNRINIDEIALLPIRWMGFVFYAGSVRDASGVTPEDVLRVPGTINKTGVFVNAGEDEILCKAEELSLNTIQLHGEESPDYCKRMRERGFEIIKALPVRDVADIKAAEKYKGSCDYLLFDTKSPERGGTGNKFNWNILDNYNQDTPFLLSGGISWQDAEIIRNMNYDKMAGVDLNSRFESEPGIKDVERLKRFISVIV